MGAKARGAERTAHARRPASVIVTPGLRVRGAERTATSLSLMRLHPRPSGAGARNSDCRRVSSPCSSLSLSRIDLSKPRLCSKFGELGQSEPGSLHCSTARSPSPARSKERERGKKPKAHPDALTAHTQRVPTSHPQPQSQPHQ